MKFTIEEILKGTNCEIRNATHNEEATENKVSKKSYIKDVEHQTVGTNQRREVCGARIMDDDLEESTHRRARTTIAGWQRQELECLFMKYRYPTFENVEQLSEQLGLPQYVIKVWFQNRRAKYRKESRRRTNNLAIAAIRHFSAIQRMPLPLQILPQRPSTIPATLVLPRRCEEGTQIGAPARNYDVAERTQNIPLQQSSHDLSNGYFERCFYNRLSHEVIPQGFRSGSASVYKQERKEYQKHRVAFLGEAADGESYEKCRCRDCERN